MTPGAPRSPLPPPAPGGQRPPPVPRTGEPTTGAAPSVTPAGTARPGGTSDQGWAWDVPLDDDGYHDPDPTGELAPPPPMRERLRNVAPTRRSLSKFVVAIAAPLAVLLVAFGLLGMAVDWRSGPSGSSDTSTTIAPTAVSRIEVSGDPLAAAVTDVNAFLDAATSGDYQRAAAFSSGQMSEQDVKDRFGGLAMDRRPVQTLLTGREQYSVRMVLIEAGNASDPKIVCVRFDVRPNAGFVSAKGEVDISRPVAERPPTVGLTQEAERLCLAQPLT